METLKLKTAVTLKNASLIAGSYIPSGEPFVPAGAIGYVEDKRVLSYRVNFGARGIWWVKFWNLERIERDRETTGSKPGN